MKKPRIYGKAPFNVAVIHDGPILLIKLHPLRLHFIEHPLKRLKPRLGEKARVKVNIPDEELQLAGVVFNAATDYLPEEALAKNTVKKIARKNKWYVFKREVEYSRSYPKGAREGLPISRTSYSRWSKVFNFQHFADEFAQRVGLGA